ncbi:hypothetical protein R1sor_023861 [Riccia sorocarpa]|uniref:Uncharacterized protein n=1 Tax=Riccia sorocarpa TaxID=122646 RepID=A0ABD3GS41_9MARC
MERKELKSMKAAAKGKKKDDGEMRQTWWRPLQGVSDERKLSILLRVDAGELSLDKMVLECARCKTLDVIMKAFCHLTGCKDWTEAQAMCGPFSTDERLYSFEKSFDLLLKDRSCSNSINKSLFGVEETEPEGGKRKSVSKAKSLVQVLPPEFLDHIDSARSYKEAKEAGREIPLPEQNYKHWVKEGALQSVKWDVFHGDTPRLPEVTSTAKTSLLLLVMVELLWWRWLFPIPSMKLSFLRRTRFLVVLEPAAVRRMTEVLGPLTEDPEGLDPEEEGAEAGEEEGVEDEQSLGEGVRVVPDSLLGE